MIRKFKNERLPNITVTVDLLTTGIDVPEICNLVFIRRVRSRILFEQMLGRATRRCYRINKDHLNIFDAVALYEALEPVCNMKAVAPDTNRTLNPYYGSNGQVDSIDNFIFDGDFMFLAKDRGYFDDPSRPVAYRINGRFWANNHVHILKTLGQIPTQFLIYSLNRADLMPFVSEITRFKLNQAAMRRIPVLLPPLKEQKRVVARIEELQAFRRTSGLQS